MKKNKMMRLASLLLVCVLLTTSVISGTFAKYVTEASGSDSARVAKWGVEVTAQGPSNFNTEYQTHDTKNYEGGITVKATEKVVAPGTSARDVDGTVTFTLSGTPEVATRVKVDIADDFKDVYLGAGTYTDYTHQIENNGAWEYETFTLDKDYHPIVWTLSIVDDADAPDAKLMEKKTLAEIVDFLENTYAADAEYAPNTPLDATFYLTWEWAFTGNDAADTYLGNLISGTVQADKYCTEIAYDITLTVEQID